MEDRVSRRRFLTTAGTAVALSSTGCSQLPGGIGQNSGVSRNIGERDESQPDEWPTLGQNPQNTKFNPGGAGPKDEPSVDWTYESENIFAPPVTNGDRIALSGIGTLSILNADGSARWTTSTGSGLFDELRSYSYPIVMTNEAVYTSTGGTLGTPLRIVSYSHDGDLRWEIELGDPSGGATPFVTYYDGIVYASIGANYSEIDSPSVMAISPDEGQAVWSETHNVSFSYPLVTEQAVISDTNERLQAYDRETGNSLWEFDLLDTRIVRPVLGDGTVYVQYGNDTVGLSVDDGSTSIEATDSFGGRFAFVDDVIIEPAGDTLRAYDLQRDELLWEQEYSASLNPPAVADGVAYVGGEDKRIRGIEIASGDELWSRQLEDDVMRPVVAQGRILTVSGDTLYSLS